MPRLWKVLLTVLLLGLFPLVVLLVAGQVQIRPIAPALPDALVLRAALALDAGPIHLYSINTASRAWL